jgi:uncharacterized protein
MSRFRLALCLSLLASFASADELTAAKSADIRRLLEITDVAKLAQQFASQNGRNMLRIMRLSRPGLSDRAQPIIEDEAAKVYAEKAAAPGGLLERVIPVYDRRFTHAEIKELLAFYRTPTGRKSLVVMPDVFREMVDVANRWGKTLRPEIQERALAVLKKEGLVAK